MNIKTSYQKYLTILASLLIFSPSLFNFFFSDDWFFFRLVNISNFRQFLNFFNFAPTAQSIPFYRPLSTQLFYFLFQIIFGLNPFFYHLFVLFLFAVSSFLVYKLGQLIFKDQKKSQILLFFYSFSAIHFTSLYYLAASQELFLVVFAFLSLQFFLKGDNSKNMILSVIFFVLGLMSKETAAILPFIFGLFLLGKPRKNFLRLIPFIIILIPYSYFKLKYRSSAVDDSYIFDFSPAKFINTLSWYVFWSLGTPEFLVDYVGSGLKIVPRFFDVLPFWSEVVLGELAISILSFGYLALKSIKKINRNLLIGSGIFLISLLPVIFFPWHKFSYYLGLPILGFGIVLTELVSLQRRKIVVMLALIVFLVINLTTIYLDNLIHYAATRGKISEAVFDYFKTNYPNKPPGSYFEFVNDTVGFSKQWGSSRQIETVVSGSNMFEVIYNDPSYTVYYEDDQSIQPPAGLTKIPISSKIFLPNL